ncbi:hypothetical protein OG535_30750 [Kitasatospora sp. NBC_00085]|uniref:hypothetical protein n=1 Tax=unclassified Kitasatospora TaxID=2633591 RepID=UPI003245288F
MAYKCRTLADRHARYHREGRSTSYKETDAALTGWKKTEDLAFLSEVSSVPLQQTLRHQHAASFARGEEVETIARTISRRWST